MGFRNWGRDAPFLFYCGWVSEKINFRKACNASEKVYKALGMVCMHHIVLFVGRTG